MCTCVYRTLGSTCTLVHTYAYYTQGQGCTQKHALACPQASPSAFLQMDFFSDRSGTGPEADLSSAHRTVRPDSLPAFSSPVLPPLFHLSCF